jgi:hypothetical protein
VPPPPSQEKFFTVDSNEDSVSSSGEYHYVRAGVIIHTQTSISIYKIYIKTGEFIAALGHTEGTPQQ